MRKKMQVEASQKPRQAQAPLSPPEERRTRSLGPSRNDSISAAPHTREFYPLGRLNYSKAAHPLSPSQSMWISLLRQSRVPSPRKKSRSGPKVPMEVC